MTSNNQNRTAYITSCLHIFTILIIAISGWLGSTVQQVKAQTLTYYAEINKSFSPINILPGEISQLQVSIYNSNAFALSEASWIDDLAGVQNGIKIASPLNYSTTNCGSSAIVTASAGGTTLALDHATVPALSGSTPGTCTVTIDVTSTISGNLVNTIPAGELTATGNGGNVTSSSPASATLNVTKILPPSVSKSFNPTTIWAGATSLLTINIANTDTANALTLVALTDPLPTNVVVAATPVLTQSNCGSATITATAGSGSIIISNGTIAKSTTCTITLRVTSTQQGTYKNTIPAGALSTRQGVTNSIAEATLAVQALNFTKAFLPTSIAAGETSKVTITLQNPTSFDYTGAHLVDSFPAGMLLSTTPTAPATTCTNGVVTYDTVSSPNSVTLTGATIPHATTIGIPSTCTLVFYVTTLPTFGSSSAASTSLTNAIASGALTTDQGVTNPAAVSQSLSIANALGGVKSMPASITSGNLATVTITLRNYTKNPFSNATFTDNLPANLTVSGTPTTTCDSGTVSTGVYSSGGMSGRTWVTLTGGTIPASLNSPSTPGTCTITFQITTSSTGSYTNTISAGGVTATNTSGVTVSNLQSFSATTSVSNSAIPVAASKSFSSSPVTPNTNVRLRILLTAPADTSLTNFSVTDTLPTGMLITNSTAASKNAICSGGTLSAVTGANVITWSGGSIAAGAQCQIDVYVAASATGTYVNTIYKAGITNNEGRTILADSFTSTLVVSGLTMSKAFYPSTINTNGLSQLTITLNNTVTQPIYNATLLDSFPANLQVASPSNAVTDCGSGTVTTTTTSVSLSGGTIPASDGVVDGKCTIVVNVKGIGSNGTRVNTIPVANVTGKLGSAGGPSISPAAQAQATLTINTLTLTINKGFQPTSVYGGSASTLSINIKNDNTAPLTNISFTDSMPAGMIIANPKEFNTGTCGGTITGNSGGASFAYSGGYLAASGSCTLTLKATMTANGNLTNTIPVGAVTTFNGATNSQAASASLTNLPGVGISKFFSPNPMVGEPGNYSLLTITIQNTASTGLTGLGLVDNLPAGTTIAATPVATTNCGSGATLTATPGTGTVRLQNGVLGGSSSCKIVVPVTGIFPGNYKNTIEANSVTSSEGATNADPATDTLVITAAPSISLLKTGSLDLNVVSPDGEANPGDKINYTFTVKNTGDVTLSGITLSDPLITVIGGPLASLAPGESDSSTFSGSYTLTQEDIEARSFTNTASVSGTSPAETVVNATDEYTQTIPTNPLLGVEKTSSFTAITAIDQVVPYAFTLSNLGNIPLSGIVVTDLKCDVAPTYVSGDADSDSKLDLVETWIFKCNHTVTQAEFDAGVALSNTVTADSVESPEVTDTLDLPIVSIQVTKDATPTEVPETGGNVTFTYAVKNTGTTSVIITSLGDDKFGTLAGDDDCKVGSSLAAGSSCSFTYTTSLSGVVGTPHVNKFTAAVEDADGNTTSDDDDATVSFTDVLPDITVTKSASPLSVPETGGNVTFTYTVLNSGNVPVSIDSLDDDIFGALSGDADCEVGTLLAAGASCSFDVTKTLSGTVGVDHVNVFTASASDIDGNSTDDSDNATVTFTDVLPAISVGKNASPDNINETGGEVTFTYTVNNIGSVPVTITSLSDDVFGTLAGDDDCKVGTHLAAGSSCDFSTVNTLSGSVGTPHQNTFTAEANDAEGNAASDSDLAEVTFNDVLPSISVAKAANPTSVNETGGDVTFTYTVTNDGTVPLTIDSLSDDVFGTLSGDAECQVGTVLASETSCSFTLIKNLSGTVGIPHVNTFTAQGSDSEGNTTNDSADATVNFNDVLPAVTVTKEASKASVLETGENVTFTFTVANTGKVQTEITALEDSVFGTLSGDADCQVGTVLAAGASCSFETTQLLSGSVATPHNNTFTATVKDAEGNTAENSDDATVTFTDVLPAITVTKSANPTSVAETGGLVTFTYEISNSGSVPVTLSSLSDDVFGTLSGDADCQIGTELAVGASCAFETTETLSGSAIVPHVNTFTAEAEDADGNTASAEDGATVNFIDVLPLLSVSKSASTSSVPESGGDVTFTFTVNNDGTVPLTITSLTDSVYGALSGDADCNVGTSLAAGASCSFELVKTLKGSTETTHTNTFTAEGQDADGNSVSNSDDASVSFSDVTPAIEITKTADPSSVPETGADVTFTFTVSNTGLVSESITSLTDSVFGTLDGDADCKVGTELAAGASCSFTLTESLSGAAGTTHTNVASVYAEDAEGNSANAEDDAVVTFTDVLPEITVTKTASPSSILYTGGEVTFTFTVANSGLVPVTITDLTDDKFGTLTGDEDCEVGTELASGADCSFEYTTTLSGEPDTVHTNTFTATAIDVDENSSQDTDTADVSLLGSAILGVAKELASKTPAAAGTYDVTYQILVKNYGTKDLFKIQVEDDLATTFPAPTLFSVVSVESTDFTVSGSYDGSTDKKLLAGTDSLLPGESGTITLVVNVTPAKLGPFYNTSSASSETSGGSPVTDVSQNGEDPDGKVEDHDDDPTNNSDPTPVSFDTLFNPPLGVKSVDATAKPVLTWSMSWMNNSNKVPQVALVHDPIPSKTTFVVDAALIGVGMPADAPLGSSMEGVSCDAGTSTTTITTMCYYEGPTSANPRGQIIWAGTLGADYGATDPLAASNAIHIKFATNNLSGTKYVKNVATIDADLNGDGDAVDTGEIKVDSVSAPWGTPPSSNNTSAVSGALIIPQTGFTPGMFTALPLQPLLSTYTDLNSLAIEIPALKVKTTIVGIPQTDAGWNITWLGDEVGWLNGTAFPTWAGNSVLTGHVYNSDGLPGPFAKLSSLKFGDQIIIHAFGQEYIYEVRETKEVSPADVTTLVQHEELPWITLVTCRGYDAASGTYQSRYLVRAVQIKIK